VRFTRNFGAHIAVSAGLAEARGDCVALMTADIQEPPDLVARFYEEWRQGHDTVWGIRTQRQQSAMGKLLSGSFYKLLVRYSDLPELPPEGPAGFLVSREVAADVTSMKERHRNLTAMISWVGYSQTVVEYEQLERNAGTTNWSLKMMIQSAIDSFVGFSHAPIRLASGVGITAAVLGLLYASASTCGAVWTRRVGDRCIWCANESARQPTPRPEIAACQVASARTASITRWTSASVRSACMGIATWRSNRSADTGQSLPAAS